MKAKTKSYKQSLQSWRSHASLLKLLSLSRYVWFPYNTHKSLVTIGKVITCEAAQGLLQT